MAKRGPKSKSPYLKSVAGTDQAGRQKKQDRPGLDGPVSLPAAFGDLKNEKPRLAKKVLAIWNEKLQTYKVRGQSVVGYESMLYQYCLLEAAVNECYLNAGPPTTMVTQLRLYAVEFFDTLASQVNINSGSGGKRVGKPRKPPWRP